MISIAALHELFLMSTGVSTDTRQIQDGSIFFALRGDKFNANEFTQTALDNGAAYVVIDEPAYQLNERCILVPSVLHTLQKLAHYHRLQFGFPVIGLSGSNGKTTNKELLAAVLAKKYRTFATKGNLNNHIGVPLSLLQLNTSHEIAVIEMGANHQGEIRLLSSIAEPTHGFLTNVGKAHLEGFGGIAGVRKGKGELFDFLAQSSGVVFLNENDAVVNEMAAERQLTNQEVYGESAGGLQLIQESPQIVFEQNGVSYTAHLSGKYNFENMQTAFAVGCYFGVAPEACCEAIAAYNPTNNRSQVVEQGSNTLFLDAYNANPSSMAASVANFANFRTPKQKLAILGDMFELGDASAAEHQALGRQVAAAGFDWVVLYGEHMQHALAHLPKAYYFTDKFSLHNWLNDKQFRNMAVLIKGSRGVGLETTVDFLKG